jgi:hypothetical protein
MPYIDHALPFSGSTPQAAHASRAGAEDAAPRALNQTVRYLALLKSRPHGCTDWEAAELLGVERTTINARRRPLVKAGLVYADGFRDGPTGVKNVVWKAR